MLAPAMSQIADTHSASPPEDVVVIARRMDAVTYAAKVNPRTGAIRCKITISSGDPQIDWQVCEIARVCAAIKPRTREKIEECVLIRKREFLATYVPPNGTK